MYGRFNFAKKTNKVSCVLTFINLRFDSQITISGGHDNLLNQATESNVTMMKRKISKLQFHLFLSTLSKTLTSVHTVCSEDFK